MRFEPSEQWPTFSHSQQKQYSPRNTLCKFGIFSVRYMINVMAYAA